MMIGHEELRSQIIMVRGRCFWMQDYLPISMALYGMQGKVEVAEIES